jgi:hypothetical protein
MNLSITNLNVRRSAAVAARQTLAMLAIALIVLAALERSAQAAPPSIETLNFDQTMQVDDASGVATVSIKMKLTAAQFQNWQNKYGSNESLLKRDMNKVLSQYDTFDWSVNKNNMEREVVVSLKARGAVLHKGGGLFEFRVPKEWRGGERHDNVFSFNYIEPLGPGSVGQYNVKLITPANASNFREQLSEQGEKVIHYTVPVAGSGAWMLVTGIILSLAGLGVIGLWAVGGTTASRSASASTSASTPSRTHVSPPRQLEQSRAPALAHPHKDIESEPSTIPLEPDSIFGQQVPHKPHK